MSRRTSPRRLAILLLFLVAPPLTLLAQDAAENDSEEAAELGTQVVTGSRLRTGPGASPVFVLTRAEIDRRGLKNIEDIVRYLPQNYSTITSGGSYDYRSPRFSQGSVTINLRGLGEGSTLVLVNGKRIAASPAENGSFTDVSTIPFAAIERVEVVTDGASAIYGSDAVGGVVNFIMKRDYRGSETSVRYENSSSGGHRRVIEQTLGLSWDTGTLMASANFQREDDVFAQDAGIDVDGDFREQGGRFFPATYAQPPLLLRFGPFPSNAPPGTRIALLPPGDGTNVNIDDILYVSNEEYATRTGNFNLLPASVSLLGPSMATPGGDHVAAYLNFSQELGNQFSIDVSGIYSKQDSTQGSHGQSISQPVPPSNYYNPFGVPVYVAYALTRELSEGKLDGFERYTESDRYDVSATLNWRIPIRDWEAQAGYSYGEFGYQNTYPGSFNSRTPEFFAAMASSDPNTAFNPFGDGSVQPLDLKQFQYTRDVGARTGEQGVLSLNLNGSVLDLAGGAVQFAFGAEMRADTLDFENFQLNPFTFRFPDAPDIVPESDNTALFAEVWVPLIGEANARTGLHRLNLQFAGRYDDYEVEGPFEGPLDPNSKRNFSDFVPKIGISWYPVENLKVRATWGEGFQAPTLPELFDPPSFFNPPFTPPFFAMPDPFNPDSNGGQFTPVFPTIVFGGNPDLRQQNSDTITFGFETAPASIPGLFLSMTWSQTDFVDKLGDLQQALGYPPLLALERPELFPGLVARDSDGILTLVSFQTGNITARKTEAVDIDARYNFSTDQGEFTVGILGTRTLALENTPAPGVDPIDMHGTQNGPAKLKGSAYIDWAWRNWTAHMTLNHSQGYTNTDPAAVSSDVSSYSTLDLQVTYSLPDSGWRVAAGAENVLDKDFPFVDNFQGVDSAQVDFRRRIVFVDIVKEFSW